MDIEEEMEARVRDIVDNISPGAKSTVLSEIKEDMERAKLLTSFISMSPGAFCVTQLSRDMNIQQDYIQDCEMMVDMGRLKRHGNKRGWYVPTNLDMKEMDFINADETPVDIWLPLQLNEKVEIYQNSVIIIAGSPNSGKTALMLNIIKENMSSLNVNYFNSEMSAGELKVRLQKFDYLDLDQWDFKAFERAGDFHDVIKPGPENLNIIDFLEVHTDFFSVGSMIKQIHDALDGSVAIIALQKNPNQDTGLGGFRSLEVTRLALALDYGTIKIVKAKNFNDENGNPNGLISNFKILHGSQLIQTDGWRKDDRKRD
jgi:hypothetical protein